MKKNEIYEGTVIALKFPNKGRSKGRDGAGSRKKYNSRTTGSFSVEKGGKETGRKFN